MTHAEFPHLFEPLTLAGQTVRNRLSLTATLTNYGQANRVTQRWTDFLIERARGGTGLLVSEVIAVDPNAVAQGAIVTAFEDENLPGFARAAKGVRDAGGHLVGQLWHPGRQQLWHPTKSPRAVSDQPDALSWTVGHVMDEDELRAVMAAYVSAAERLQRCGFSGIELHGAHGYLITQLLSPWSNTRQDAFGGNLENRARFALETAQTIRERCGEDFIIGLKMPADEGVEGGIDPEEAARLTDHLAAPGAFDYFSYGQGNFSLSLETHVPDLYFEPGHYLHLHKRMRAAARKTPVIGLGRIGTPELAERALAEGCCDLVGMTRALIADAAFAAKAESGRAAEIRPSVFDNWCWGEVHAGKPLAEFHNPHLGEAGEADWAPAPAAVRRDIAVIGAGPAGLEAAWVAAARGHRVTLYDSQAAPGGALAWDAGLPGRDGMARVTDYQWRLVEHHGVEPRLGQTVDAAMLKAAAPDAVVLATGADLRPPPSLTVCAGPTVSARDYRPGLAHEDQRVVLFDFDHGPSVYALADLLAERHREVVLVTPRPHIAQNVNYCSAIGVHRRLYERNVELLLAHEPVIFAADGTLTCRNVYTGGKRELAQVGLLVYATPRLVRDGLAGQLDGMELHLAGDCMAPRHLMAAIHEGHAIGNRL